MRVPTMPGGGGDFSIITGPGTYYTTQLWMSALYDMASLQRLEMQAQNTPVGTPLLTPRRVQTGYANTMLAATQIPPGDSTVNGIIPEWLRFTFTGARIGGNVSALEPGWAPSGMPDPCEDRCHYAEGKAAMAAVVMRGADASNDPLLRNFAIALTDLGIDTLEAIPQPLNKAVGIGLTKLHASVARITAPVSVPVLFASGFE